MPKNSALLEEIEAVIRIYAEENNWLSNDEYKVRLKKVIGEDQYESSYTKKAQIPSYFGFTEWKDIKNVRSMRRITASGLAFYNHLKNQDKEGMIEDLISALEDVTFGRDNFGCPDSDSDIEPPVVFVRAAMDLGYLTYKEFAFLLWKLEDVGGNYTDAKAEIVKNRNNSQFVLPDAARNYTDAKPIMALIRWGLLSEDGSDRVAKHIIIPKWIVERYGERIQNLKIYNIDKDRKTAQIIDSMPVEKGNYLSNEWFKAQAVKLTTVDECAEKLYSDFSKKFAPEILKSYSGIELLRYVFLSDLSNKDSLCYTLEYNTDYSMFGSISGGNSYKYGLFYSKERAAWVSGSWKKPVLLDLTQAINLGTEIRNELCAGAEIIKGHANFNSIEGYAALHSKLVSAMPKLYDKIWVMKYFHMIFPSMFPVFYNAEWVNSTLEKINEEQTNDAFLGMAKIALFVKRCGISNIAFSKIIHSIKNSPTDNDECEYVPVKFNTGYKSGFGRNRIKFGAPGTGKSYTLKIEADELVGNSAYERVTFHPDYTYANFVGSYKPVPIKDEQGRDIITYKYVPGPFMRVYVNALKNSRTAEPKPFLLVIEEINRANVAAVFGDVFQLLDRDEDFVSQYGIAASEDMKSYLAEALDGETGDSDNYAYIKLPDNMFIWATMNSADQGVFPMDTAFKRRWEFSYMGINAGEQKIEGKTVVLGQGNYEQVVEWNALRRAINKVLYSYKINEDKLIGPFFLSMKILDNNGEIDRNRFIEMFKSKVLMYLFDDAAKQKRDRLFDGIVGDVLTYSSLCDEFDKKGINVFCGEIVSALNKANSGEN